MEKEIKESINIEDKLENGIWKEAVKSVTLPEQMKQVLMIQKEKPERKVNFRLRYAKALPALCMALMLLFSGMTVYAVYMNTHLNIFFELDITKEEISQIESELGQMEGISSWRYMNGDTAWKEFSEAYLSPELTEQFEDNPLADSANFEVTISLSADAEQVKAYFEKLDGVRKVSLFSEEE